MKNIRYKFIGMVILVALFLGSCKKWIDTGINVNADASADVPMKVLLPGIQAEMACNTIGGNDIALVTDMWMQYFQGVGRQSQGTANYTWKDADVDNQWNVNFGRTMMDLTILTNKARDAHHMMYLGISDVLMAEAMGITTDFWGDMPFSDAFKGLKQLNPGFDSQQAIYAELLRRLDEAIASLKTENLLFAEGDLMYGSSGNAANQAALWLKAANGMKARYLLHLCKQDPSSFEKALAAINDGSLAGNDDDLQFSFTAGQGGQNPLFLFMNQRSGDIAMHQAFIDTLTKRFDPRLPAFATSGPGVGWDENITDTSALPGPAVASGESPVPFLTYAECMFIKAECELKTNVPAAQVRADLVEGLTASLEKYGVYNVTYIQFYTAAIQNLTGDTLYREIMMQKYIAMYHQAEAFADWRRTGNLIGLAPNPNLAAQLPPSGKREIPRRFPYPLGEKNYNPNAAPYKNVTIWERVWWDKEPGTGKK